MNLSVPVIRPMAQILQDIGMSPNTGVAQRLIAMGTEHVYRTALAHSILKPAFYIDFGVPREHAYLLNYSVIAAMDQYLVDKRDYIWAVENGVATTNQGGDEDAHETRRL